MYLLIIFLYIYSHSLLQKFLSISRVIRSIVLNVPKQPHIILLLATIPYLTRCVLCIQNDPKKVYPFFKCYNFSTNYNILNLFVLFDVEFNCISVSAGINENT